MDKSRNKLAAGAAAVTEIRVAVIFNPLSAKTEI